MHADFDLQPNGEVKPRGRGRPPGYSQTKARLMEQSGEDLMGDSPAGGEDVTTTAIRKARALARKEEALAGLNELDLKVKSGQYLERAAFREAAATLLSELAQSLRSLPDALERKHALAPKVVQEVERTIDEALEAAAASLEMFTGAS